MWFSYQVTMLLTYKTWKCLVFMQQFHIFLTIFDSSLLKIYFLISWHYKLLDSKEFSISCFLPASTIQAKTWKPKTPATFQQTKAGIMFSALRSFYCRQIQRALISFQLPNLLTSFFSFSVWGLLSEMANKPLVSKLCRNKWMLLTVSTKP